MGRWINACRKAGVCWFLTTGSVVLFGQLPQQAGAQASPQTFVATQQPVGANQAAITPTIRPDYVLGPNDQILVRVPQEEQINERPFRIDPDGFVSLPVAGRVKAEGLTVQAMEAELAQRLRQYILNPLVSITVVQYRSDPVFFVGAFRVPGIYPLQGRRTLVEMLAAVGGTLPNASRRIKVTRRADHGPIPLPQAIQDTEKKTSTVEISMRSLTENINPEEDIVLQAYDIVSVERAEKVYVSGEVLRTSAIELGERESISVVQAMTEAGGFGPNAVRDRVMVLRPVLGTNRRAVLPVDVSKIFAGKEVDFPLLPNDVLLVQRSSTRAFLVPVSTQLVSSLPYLIITALLRR